MEGYLGQMVNVIIDRPLGSRHPKHGFIYSVNYGYIPGTVAGDGQEIDAYILGEFEPLKEYRGRVIAMIKRKNDQEDKLVVAKTLNSYSSDQIKALTEFVESSFDTEIICCAGKVAPPYIRPLALGLARRGDDILVAEIYDAIRNETFYRFPGGGIEFGEESLMALRREFLEELNAEVTNEKYLCLIENRFTFEGRKGHEIVIVYEVTLPESFYRQDEFVLNENNALGKAYWVSKNDFLSGQKILYPAEIKKYL